MAAELARRNRHAVFITLAERGIIGALPDAAAVHVPALPVHGPIDIVGAGDTGTATLTLALAAGAELREALELAQAAASVVIHQLGTTGVATAGGVRAGGLRASAELCGALLARRSAVAGVFAAGQNRAARSAARSGAGSGGAGQAAGCAGCSRACSAG